MKKITTLLILLLSLGVYSQGNKLPEFTFMNNIEVNNHGDVTIQSQGNPIEKLEIARLKGYKYISLKTIRPQAKEYTIPNNYFKYKKIRITTTVGKEIFVQDFITKSKRK